MLSAVILDGDMVLATPNPTEQAQARGIRAVAVLGLGNVGSLVASMLVDDGYRVVPVDQDVTATGPEDAVGLDVTDGEALLKLFGQVDAVVSCLPYQLNAGIAQKAAEAGIHYLDLTEDRGTSAVVRNIARGARTAVIPHCGLAPGFVCIAAAGVARRLAEPERIIMRVGALPRNPSGALGYAFNWSPAGVVNEYVNDCEVLRGGVRTAIAPLTELEPAIVDGLKLEAFSTSGGLGTMCETFAGKVRTLDYKSLRYPGHCQLMRFLLTELDLASRREEVVRLLQESCPAVSDDLVVFLAAAEGPGESGRVREELARVYRPRIVAGQERTAIAWTTAAGVTGVFELLATGRLPQAGFVRQEDVPLEAFAETRGGKLLAHAVTMVGSASRSAEQGTALA